MSAGVQPEIFQGSFVELVHFDRRLFKNNRKKAPHGNILEFFLLEILKVTFWTELRTSVVEYASKSLNIPKYPWKCLNKLFWLFQGSEYSCLSYVFDRLLKMPWVLNVPRFNASVTQSHKCGSLCLNNAWICLSIP